MAGEAGRRTLIPFSLMVTVRNFRSCSVTKACPAVSRSLVWWAGIPVAAASSPRLGQTVVAPVYLLKSGGLGSARTGMPAVLAARIIAAQRVVERAPLA